MVQLLSVGSCFFMLQTLFVSALLASEHTSVLTETKILNLATLNMLPYASTIHYIYLQQQLFQVPTFYLLFAIRSLLDFPWLSWEDRLLEKWIVTTHLITVVTQYTYTMATSIMWMWVVYNLMLPLNSLMALTFHSFNGISRKWCVCMHCKKNQCMQ